MSHFLHPVRAGWLLAAGLALLLGSPAAAQTTIAGRVVDAATGEPIEGASVRLAQAGRSALTGADGRFRIADVAFGSTAAVVSRIGYEVSGHEWLAEGPEVSVEVRLQPDQVVLEDLRVRADQFQRRRESSALPTRSFSQERLWMSGAANLAEFLAAIGAAVPVACGWLAGYSDGPMDGPSLGGMSGTERDPTCLHVRGAPITPCIIIDEQRSMRGWADLELLRPAEIYSVDVISSGKSVQIYTVEFIRRRAGRRWRPLGVETQMALRCLK